MKSRKRRGFVVVAVIFALVVMSVVSVVALRTSTDERRSVLAYRGSTAAFYAAEAGLRYTLGSWPVTTSPAISALNSGDSVVVTSGGSEWVPLGNNAGSYRTMIHRVDNATTKVFLIVVQGRGPDKLSGQRALEAVVSYASTS